jgi:hypothetical protein
MTRRVLPGPWIAMAADEGAICARYIYGGDQLAAPAVTTGEGGHPTGLVFLN